MHCSCVWHLQLLRACLLSLAWPPAGLQAAAAQQHISETPSDGGPGGSAAHLAFQVAAPAQHLLLRDAHLDCGSTPASPSALGQPQSHHRALPRPGAEGAAPAGSLERPGGEGVRPVPETPDGAEDRSQPAETPKGDRFGEHAAVACGRCVLCLPGDYRFLNKALHVAALLQNACFESQGLCSYASSSDCCPAIPWKGRQLQAAKMPSLLLCLCRLCEHPASAAEPEGVLLT